MTNAGTLARGNGLLAMTAARIGKLLDEIGALKEKLMPRKSARVIFRRVTEKASQQRRAIPPEERDADVAIYTVYESKPAAKPIKAGASPGRAR